MVDRLVPARHAGPLLHRRVALRDGRAIGVDELGAPDGSPAFYFHGFLASRLEARLAADAARRCGVRLIALDRPGFGASDPSPSRTIADWPDDVAQVADALAIERFAIVGVSGGGPYALACAAALARRVDAVAIVGGLGTVAADEDLADFARAPRLAFALARRYPAASHALNRSLAHVLQRRPDLMMTFLAARASAADRRVLGEPRVMSALTASLVEALRHGADPASQELALYTRPWNFALEGIAARCDLWYGDEDRTVPASVGRRLALHLPRSRATFMPGEGHFSLPLRHADRILTALRASR